MRRVSSLLSSATSLPWFALLCCLAACRVLDGAPEPVSSEASAAFARARVQARRDDDEGRLAALESATRARDLAPEWVAPQRFLDELLRSELRGLEALDGHRRALAERPNDPRELYLAGRLEGTAGTRRFEQAVQRDPDFAWGWHGLAWTAAAQGDWTLAVRHGERALDCAREAWERVCFGAALARYLDRDERSIEALDVLARLIDDPMLEPTDRLELELQSIGIGLALLFDPRSTRGARRALELLREEDLTEAEIDTLMTRLRFSPIQDSTGALELSLALAARSSPARDRWRAVLMLEDRANPLALALALLERARDAGEKSAADGPLLRVARFAAGQYARGVDEWLADLPRVVLSTDGLPRDSRIGEVVRAARAAGTTRTASHAALVELGNATLAAGWFREARSVANALTEYDLEAALALDERASVGIDLIRGLRALFGPDERRRRDDRASVASLASLLRSAAPLFARLDGAADRAAVSRKARELAASPRIAYGAFGSLVHPGPRLSALDERQGLGPAGETVGGLAAALDRIGRFGIFGKLMGSPPDGTLLPRLWIEELAGERLGVPWRGTIAWCETADLQSSAARAGAAISGAALHEGYWIDIDVVRRERDAWLALEREFMGDERVHWNERNGRIGRAERALSVRGLPIEAPPNLRELYSAERRSIDVLLGEAERVRLAVLRDRARGPVVEAGLRRPGLVDLDDLVAVTAIHEEGHLCDRTRFFPLTSHWGRALGFLARHLFSPEAIAERLEYRAQLIALCESADPRLPLADVLAATEAGSEGLTPHAEAYRRLLADWLALLDAELERDPVRWPELDPTRVLVQELHRLGPERIRELARTLARREGLFER
ncbi:MAG: hypothetical protein HZA52_11015 [Planctomycetes bacterium]|nr:hypothetical protein [Planctomycetota bacterium]